MRNLFLACLLAATALSGCAFVSVIQPVALQNSRNADALHTNMTAFFDADEPFFRAVIRVQLVEDYRKVIRSIQADKPTANDPIGIAGYYRHNADGLSVTVEDLSEEAKQIEISRYHRERPLTAAVAFAGMTPEVAASKWTRFKAIRQAQVLSDADKFSFYQEQVSELPFLEHRQKAATGLLSAYATRKAIVLQQVGNAKEIAGQLVTASSANYDAGQFLHGVLENDEVIKGLSEYVLSSSKDPIRKRAAEELLKSIVTEEKK